MTHYISLYSIRLYCIVLLAVLADTVPRRIHTTRRFWDDVYIKLWGKKMFGDERKVVGSIEGSIEGRDREIGVE